MARKNKKNGSTVGVVSKKMANMSMAKKTRVKPRKPRMALNRATLRFAQLVSDPCYGPLTRAVGFTDSIGSVIERTRQTYTFPKFAGDKCGYIIWFPGFHGKGTAANGNANLYVFENVDATVEPVNTLANPMGSDTGTPSLAGSFLEDPAFSNLGTGAFGRAKSLAACLQLEYLGKLSEISGQVAVISNISLSAFNANTGAAVSTFRPPSVDRLFSYAAERERLGVEGTEVIWRPSDEACVLRSSDVEEQGTPTTGAFTAGDSCFWRGAATSHYTHAVATMPQAVNGICIAWRGLPATELNMISINCVKVADYELAPKNYAIEPPPATPADTSVTSTVAEAVGFLDTYVPGWQRKAFHAAGEITKFIGNLYAPPGLSRNVNGSLRNSNLLRIMDGEL